MTASQIMPLPEWLQASGDVVLLNLKVQPRARVDEIGPPVGPALKVKVTAPPVDSAANEAVLRLVADTLRLRRGNVRLVRGQTSRQKIVEVRGLTPADVALRLGAP